MQQYPVGNAQTEIRDIRGDLQERANLLEEQISAATADFEEAVKRLQCELKAKLAALGTTMLADEYRAFLSEFLESDRIR
jgi:hypothetical protein